MVLLHSFIFSQVIIDHWTKSFGFCMDFMVAQKDMIILERSCIKSMLIDGGHNQNTISFLLAHLSWKLKWAFLITFHPSVCLSVCPSVCKLFKFSSSSQNHWANFNQTWHKVSLDIGDSNEGPRFSQRGDNNKTAKIRIRNIKVFFAEPLDHFNQTWHKAFLGERDSRICKKHFLIIEKEKIVFMSTPHLYCNIPK